MDDLSSEILLSIFKKLTSVEFINVIPVCRKWLGVIDDNKSLWRRLVLPYKDSGWDPLPPLTIFDQKSESGIKQLTMKMKRLPNAESTAFRELLERSKGTLEIINIGNCFDPSLIDLSWKCSNLIDFRLVGTRRMRIELLGDLESESDGSRLKILWIPEQCDTLFTSHVHLLVNLVSLSVGEYLKFDIWRRILEVCGGNLKHLQMQVDLSDQPLRILPIELPKLKALEYSNVSYFSNIPDKPSYWLKAPLLSFLRTNKGFPPCRFVSILSHTSGPRMNRIENNYPNLVELMQAVNPQSRKNFLGETHWDTLWSMLRRRKINVEAGMEVDGVEMIPLKRVVVFIANWSEQKIDVMEAKLAQLRLLVDEVQAVDGLTTVPVVEVDI